MYSNLSFNFANQNYLVTGASSGMGRLVAEELAKAGATVLAMDRQKDMLQKLASEHVGNIVPVTIDVTDYAAVENAVKGFVSAKGKLNGIIYAAGITLKHSVRGCPLEDAHTLFEVNFWGALNLISKCISVKYMSNGSSTVLFCSQSAHKGSRGTAMYAASKSAMIGLIRSCALEIAAKGHRINLVSPGWITGTGMTGSSSMAAQVSEVDNYAKEYPLGPGRPEDVVGAVLFLLSDAARWITGTDILIDGGRLA